MTSRLFVGGIGIEFPAMVVAAALLIWWTDRAIQQDLDRSGLAVGANPAAVDGECEDLIVGHQAVVDEVQDLLG